MKKEVESLSDRMYEETLQLLQTDEMAEELLAAVKGIRAAELDGKGQPRTGMDQLLYCFIRVFYEGYAKGIKEMVSILDKEIKRRERRKPNEI